MAKACGTTPHPEMQWHAILGLGDPDQLRGSYAPSDGSGVKWAGSDPPTGGLDIETLDALCDVLTTHTAEPTQCLFGLCTIHGWVGSPSATPPLSLLELPAGRNHIVLSGPLSAMDQVTWDWSGSLELPLSGGDALPGQDSADLLQREAPSLIWPADRSWFVASEVDFDSTLIGASATLIDAIIDSPALEAWPIEESASLAADADTINGSVQPQSRIDNAP